MTTTDANAILVEVKSLRGEIERDRVILRQELERDRSLLKEDLDQIKQQTIRTNGRVSALEKWRIERDAKESSRSGWLKWIVPVVTGTMSGSSVVVLSLLLTDKI